MTLVYILVGLLLVLGLLRSVLPFLPGTLLILVGAVVFACATDFATLGPIQWLILAALTAIAYGVDYVAGALGVKRIGGSRWAMLGAALEAVVGTFFGPLGLILGPIIGAVRNCRRAFSQYRKNAPTPPASLSRSAAAPRTCSYFPSMSIASSPSLATTSLIVRTSAPQ